MDKKLFLLDAYALIFRAYYAFIKNPRINSKGLNTSAIFGFTLALDDVLKKENPSHIGVVFDPPGPTFRHSMFPEYKANREATPEDIKIAVPYIKQLLDAYKIPVIEVSGYEADDTIGTLAKQAAKEGFEVYMMTPDKDYAQLVDTNIFMYKPKRSGKDVEIIGKDNIADIFNVDKPEQVVDILGLMGDSSDNIPGCPGIGPKTATKLIAKYGSIEALYENINQTQGKQKENLENFKEQVFLSKELAQIKLDVPVDFEPDKLINEEKNIERLTALFEELEFKTLLQRNVGENSESPAAKSTVPEQGSLFAMDGQVSEAARKNLKNIESEEHRYELVDTEEKRKNLIEQLQKQDEFCFDTETTSVQAMEAELVGLSFSFEKANAYYIPFSTDRNETINILSSFKPIFENRNTLKIGQNLKYDMLVLRNYGIHVAGPYFDTLIAHYLIQPEQKHKLDFLAEHFLGYEMVHIESLIGKKGKNQLNMRSVPVDEVKEYAGEDADITFQLKKILKEKLAENNLETLFTDIEMPLIPVLTDMEYNGVKVSSEILDKYAEKLREELIGLEKKIIDHAGIEFNISSPKQLGEILFDRLKIDEGAKKTKTKQYSTSEETLIRLVDKHPIVNLVLEFRSVKKLLTTYIEALPKLVNTKTGKIHTSFNQAITATGRLSSNNPNLQNIPIREERGKEIRKAFIASDNEHTILSADYSQIELRLMAHMSEDKGMIDDFNADVDIHKATAAKVNKVELNEVSAEMRSKAKTANFGIIYGISAFGLSQRLNIPRKEAKQLIDSYFETYTSIKSFMDDSISVAREKGYVETLFGRKRHLPDINSRNAIVRGVAERNAINAPVQGTAADIIKIAMIRVFQKMKEQNLESKIILQVHDELVFDVKMEELDRLKEIVVNEMQNAAQLSVPLLVEYGTGENWLEAH